MNIAAALKQMDTQAKVLNLEIHQYTLFRGQVGVVLLSSTELPSRPILARGIAIQNPLDTPSPKIRLYWALRRALHAYKTRTNSETINSFSRFPLTSRLLIATRFAFIVEDHPIVYKSQYAPIIPQEGTTAHKFESAIIERLNRESLGQEVKG